jgi:hypothetical protein
MHDLSVLYFIRHIKTKMIKIGITANWSARACALKSGKETEVIAIFNADDVRSAESQIHAKARKYRLPGSEYFALPEKELSRLLEICQEKYRDVTRLILLFYDIKESDKLDVSRAMWLSAKDWLRLNRSTWQRSLAQDDLRYMLNTGEINRKEYQDCVSSLTKIAYSIRVKKNCFNLYGDWFMECLAAEKVFIHCSEKISCFVSKSLFHRTKTKSGIEARAKKNLELGTDVQMNWHDSCFSVEGVNISHKTADIICRLLFEYRLTNYCTNAYNAFLKPQSFDYYLSSFGPI